MIPGKSYKPEDFAEILWRRKWLGIIPFVLIAIATVVGTQFLPNRYSSEARVLIVPQQVPENYVQATVTTPLDQRLNAITQQIQTRTRLERIILELNLYEDQRKTEIMEDIVELMRRNITVDVTRSRGRRAAPNSFVVGFESDEPRTAMQVTDRLASLYVNESVQDRAVQADQTNQFLQSELDDARRRLEEQEQKLETFKRTFSGQLPSQVQSNLQVMQAAQNELQSQAESVNRDRDRIYTIDKQMSDIVAAAAAAGGGGADGVSSDAAKKLAAAREQLASLERRLKPEHPDVARARRAIKQLEEDAKAEGLSAPLAEGGLATTTLPPSEQKRLSALQTERESLERKIVGSRAEEARLRQTIEAYRGRVDAAPERDSDLTRLTRDYDITNKTYQTLLARIEQARIAAKMEHRQIGEQFRIIESARLPQRPTSPNLLRLNLMGTFAGLGFGVLLIGFMEYRDTSLRTDDDVTLSLALPVLAVIPRMQTNVERTRVRRQRLLTASASVAVTLGVVAIAVWKLLLDRVP